MKNLNLISAVLFLSISVFAQDKKSSTIINDKNLESIEKTKSIQIFTSERNELKGFAYKNYKPWKQREAKKSEAITLVKSKKSNLKGPDYKNYKHFKNDDTNSEAIVLVESKRKDLKGPAFKNYKPWQNK